MQGRKDLMQCCGDSSDMPIRSALMVRAEFIELSGTTSDRVNELLDMEWLHPTRTADEALLFGPSDVYRLRKLERLCADFDLHTVAGTIIVDLLERIERLENQLRRY